MKVLLDTNIIIERETSRGNHKSIGILFSWLDKLNYQKCIQKVTLEEIEKHKDKSLKDSFKIKLESYVLLKTEAPMGPEINEIRQEFDTSENDFNDTRLLNELVNDRVDLLITEDKVIHKKAEKLGLGEKVFRIESFLEKANAENPNLVEYKNLLAKKKLFGEISIKDPFFDIFREDYPGFDKWFNSKANDPAYMCSSPTGEVLAFLYLKKEDETEDYSSEGKKIDPAFPKKKRLKIGTFKINLNGYKLGERFLKIVFDNALRQKVDEIYVTIFDEGEEKKRLIELLEGWGFKEWGVKTSVAGIEKVYVRNFEKTFNQSNPKSTFPYISLKSDVRFVPILPMYHTDLLPDSMLNTESSENFIENKAFRNALSKIYVSHSLNRDLKKGDILLFYRTRDGGPARYTSVITTLGIVESVVPNIKNEEELISLCSKRSVFGKNQLSYLWNKSSNLKPFVINFLYTYSFPHRINLQGLINMGIVPGVMNLLKPFDKISPGDFEKILKETRTDPNIIVS